MEQVQIEIILQFTVHHHKLLLPIRILPSRFFILIHRKHYPRIPTCPSNSSIPSLIIPLRHPRPTPLLILIFFRPTQPMPQRPQYLRVHSGDVLQISPEPRMHGPLALYVRSVIRGVLGGEGYERGG